MTPIPLTPEIAAIAKRIVWFETPSVAVADPIRFMAYAMARASHEEMQVIFQHLTAHDLIEALDHAPPGIIDGRSWAYWNLRAGRHPAPAIPQRKL